MGLARSVADTIHSFRRNPTGEVECRELHATPNYPQLMGEMSFSSWTELGCDRVLLVEGTTDVQVVHDWMCKLGGGKSTFVVPLGGDAMNAAAQGGSLAEFGKLGLKVFVVIDSERSDQHKHLERKKFADHCRSLHFDIHLTEKNAMENFFTQTAIDAVFGAGKKSALTESQLLRDLGSRAWRKSENANIARAMTTLEIEETDVGKFLARVVAHTSPETVSDR
jgi:hypothetical protein